MHDLAPGLRHAAQPEELLLWCGCLLEQHLWKGDSYSADRSRSGSHRHSIQRWNTLNWKKNSLTERICTWKKLYSIFSIQVYFLLWLMKTFVITIGVAVLLVLCNYCSSLLIGRLSVQ